MGVQQPDRANLELRMVFHGANSDVFLVGFTLAEWFPDVPDDEEVFVFSPIFSSKPINGVDCNGDRNCFSNRLTTSQIEFLQMPVMVNSW